MQNPFTTLLANKVSLELNTYISEISLSRKHYLFPESGPYQSYGITPISALDNGLLKSLV